MSLQFSNGQLEKSKRRHGLGHIVIHGEQASADMTAADKALPDFREQLNG